ncbi:SDR family NAD(P)-dependent oxidoreductase [Micromonospora sp. WMMD1102]|uniref:type I polyketide synthase n=1 Tax=Micromonospora sp. WMMD1102 TaxID=3016105 RepID=UPI0024157039|nr:type I polyketide synthase [Micromonospora sp. WMMD1102]MDG4785102.1 SDR family NAD(P)-dependent oxidoreductase [Micromonospora sp. WMMD1102]
MATEQELRDYVKRAAGELSRVRRRMAEVEEQARAPIAIIGMACRYPGADSVEEYWRRLADGHDAVADVPAERFDLTPYQRDWGVYTRRAALLAEIDGFDAEAFGISPQEALRTDPQQRLLLELVWQAMEDAGTPATELAGSRTGVLMGFFDTFQYGRIQAEAEGIRAFTDPYLVQGSAPSVAAGRIAYHFDLRGPTLTIDTACSSSLVAVHLAMQSLRRDECELAIAGGGFLAMQPDAAFVYGCAASMLSPSGACRTFDADADGYVLGEGGGIVVLERLSAALRNGRRIHGVLRGSAVNQDGRSNGLTAPNRAAQAAVIQAALADAGAAADEVSYVEAHGSATRLGDAIEISALHDVFGRRDPERPLFVGAVKTNIGHTVSGAGVAGLIKTALVLRHGVVPPNLNQTSPAGSVPADGTIRPAIGRQVLDEDRSRVAAVSSFGWSGTNAHVVVEAAPARPAPPAAEPGGAQLLPVSAAGEPALAARLRGLADRVAAEPGLRLGDLAYTLQRGRTGHEFRRAVVADHPAGAAEQLGNAVALPAVRRSKSRPRLAFLLPGVGDQYPGLARDLYATEPAFAATVDRCVAVLRDQCGVDLRPVLFPVAGATAPADGSLAALLGRAAAPDPAEDELNRAELSHPFLFTVEYALADLLAHWGVTPDVLVGYSLGEYVAACLAGVFTLDDALRLVVERARLIASAEAGHMLAVSAGAEQVRAALAGCGSGADLAALNGPQMTVVSGRPAEVEKIRAHLVAAGVAARLLRSSHPFHSSLLAPVRDRLAAAVAAVPRCEPTVTIVSNTTGRPLTAAQATDPEYWADHLCRPVRFADGIACAATLGVDAYVEVGPGQTLGGLVRHGSTGSVAVLGTLPGPWPAERRDEARPAVLQTAGRLWELGADLDWAALGPPGRLVDLPAYPFQRTRYWPAAGTAPVRVEPVEATATADHCYVPVWRRDSAVRTPATELPGPLVVIADGTELGERLVDAVRSPALLVRRPDDYRRAFAAAAEAGPGPVHVVHLGVLAAGADDPDAAIRHGFDSLLPAVQALAGLAGSHGVRLLTVSAGATEVVGGDGVAPARAIVHGFGRLAPAEYPGLTWRGVDLPAEGDPAAGAAELVEELARGPWPGAEHDFAVRRRGQRLLRGWGPLPVDGAAPERRPWRPDGTYLITGGTRGLGMALARHLVQAGVRRLALVGRTPLDPDRPAPDDRAAQSLRDVAELERQGAEVLLLTADTGVPDELRTALRRCREHFGALTGVVHAAGQPAGGLAAGRTAADARPVLAPKVLAMGPLAELAGPGSAPESRPELVVLYSSAVTALGGIGETEYAAANAVLDSYAAALAGAGTRVLSVAWGPWRHDAWGTGGGPVAERVADYRRRHGFTDEAGCALLDRLADTADGQVLALRQPLAAARGEWARLTDPDPAAGGPDQGQDGPRYPRPQLRTAYLAPGSVLESMIAETWGRFLAIDRVGVQDPFFELGGNSLIGMSLAAALERQLGRSVPPALLFEHPTVAAMAAALGEAAGTAGGGTGHPAGPAGHRPDATARNDARNERRRAALAGSGQRAARRAQQEASREAGGDHR